MKPGVSLAIEIALLLLLPAALLICAVLQIDQSGVISFAAALACLAAFFFLFEKSRPSLRTIMPTVVLAALAAAGRILFAPLPDVKPVTAICIMAGVVFGRRSGFMVGALAALVSNFFFGQGAWTPFQMYAWGLIGWLAGALADAGAFSWGDDRRTSPWLYVFGFASCLLYGFILNSWYLVAWVHPITWPAALATYGAGFGLDVVHAVATTVFLALLYAPWHVKLRRIRTKFALRA